MKGRIKKKIILGFLLFLLVAGGIFGFFVFQFVPSQFKAEEEKFVIKQDAQEQEVMEKLHSEGFIKNKEAFDFVLKYKGWQRKIKPGGYEISKSMWPWQIADVLVNNPSQRWVFIREGLRVEEIAETLRVSLGWDKNEKQEFLNSAKEGYMWPDTYLFDLNSSGEDMVRRMLNEFNENFSELAIQTLEKNVRNDTVIILASLIQREAANDEEMPIISGIIWNRLLDDYYLQIDATLQYALGGPGNWWPKITGKQYKMDSPYNTYTNKGRPPGPICSPGLAAIKAVIFPQETDYFYYLHDREGKIHYAKTFEEHLENIEEYFYNNEQ